MFTEQQKDEIIKQVEKNYLAKVKRNKSKTLKILKQVNNNKFAEIINTIFEEAGIVDNAIFSTFSGMDYFNSSIKQMDVLLKETFLCYVDIYTSDSKQVWIKGHNEILVKKVYNRLSGRGYDVTFSEERLPYGKPGETTYFIIKVEIEDLNPIMRSGQSEKFISKEM